MFRFEQYEYLYLIGIIPVLILLMILSRYWLGTELAKLSNKRLYNRLVPDLSIFKKNLKFISVLLSVLFICIAWANPQWGNKKEKVKAKSSDVFIALDISQSMMAEDISPNRLERAKRLSQNLIRGLRGNRIGLIYFAGNAYLQMPLSSDYAAAELFIQSANTKQAGTQGTAIAEAVNLAQRAFEEDKDYQRALVIITDGENHDDEALQAVRTAKANGLISYAIGIGTEEGDFIPFLSQGREQYKRDKQGLPVKSALNVQLLKDIAEAGGGEFYLAQEGNQLVLDLKSEIAKIAKQEIEQKSFTEYASYFQYFLALGILFLLLEFLLSNKSGRKNSKRLFEI